jgi:hypothetical protein
MSAEVLKRRYGEKHKFLWFVSAYETCPRTQWTGHFLSLLKLIRKIKFWAAKLQQVLAVEIFRGTFQVNNQNAQPI